MNHIFIKIFDLLLISENLWNGNGESPYTYIFIPRSMTDQILQNEIVTNRIASGTMSMKKGIMDLDNKNKKAVLKDYQEIIEEQKEELKILGDNENYNKQSNENSIN